MAHANVIQSQSIPPPIGDGVAGAWRRLWGAKDPDADVLISRPSSNKPPGEPLPSGVTYRGYLGATGGVSDAWMSEEQLKQTQALLKMAAGAGRLGAWSVDLSDMKWVWSDEVKAIHDLGADYQPNNEEALQFYTPASQETILAAFKACIKAGTPFDLELQMLTARSRVVWIRAIGEPERDAEGRVTHVRGAIQDISKFKAVADEARRTAVRFAQTLEGLSEGYVLLDPDYCFVYLNPEAARILRRDPSRLIGKCLLTEFPETAAGKFLVKCQEALLTGRTVEFERFFRPLSIWLHMKIWPSDQGLTLCMRDDTERVAARREILGLKAQIEALQKR